MLELTREVSAQHLPGFLWNGVIFEESDTRLRRRFNCFALYRELIDGIRRNHGTTLYGLMVSDMALRIERATESYELDAAGAALARPRDGLTDEHYRNVLFITVRMLGDA
jgi:hypothetical protein